MLSARRLDVETDRASLLEFLRWLNRWSPENKRAVQEQLEERSAAFPGLGMGKLLQFPEMR